MKTIFSLLFILSISITGCDRPNPEPEKIDPIYSDIQSKIGSINSQIKSAENDLQDKKKDLAKVVPQTGQNKFAQKRVDDAQRALDKLLQLKEFWELRAESRKKWAREHYLKAFYKKEPWPNPKEYEEYLAQKKMEEASPTWNAKQRVLDYASPPPPPKASGGGHH
jgi:hypothetical protein